MNTMPRYFFDVFDGQESIRGEEPIECASLDEVRFTAIDGLPDLARDTLPDGDSRQMSVRVRDEEDRVVFEASLLFSSRWLIDRDAN